MKNERIRVVVRKHFDVLAKQYDEKASKRACYLSTIDKTIIKISDQKEIDSKRIIDVGCGTGSRIRKIFSLSQETIIYGADASMNMLEIAKTKNLNGLVCADM